MAWENGSEIKVHKGCARGLVEGSSSCGGGLFFLGGELMWGPARSIKGDLEDFGNSLVVFFSWLMRIHFFHGHVVFNLYWEGFSECG